MIRRGAFTREYLSYQFCKADAHFTHRIEIGLVIVIQLTGSTFYVGLLSLAQLVPLLTLTIVGGAFADVFDRRRLMLLQQAGLIVGGAIVLANAALPHPRVWPCFLCIVVDACAFSFGIGAQNALLPRIVGDDELVAANNLLSLIESFAAVAGPALTGVLIAGAGLVTAYAIDKSRGRTGGSI